MRRADWLSICLNALAVALAPVAVLASKAVVPLVSVLALGAAIAAWRHHGWRPRPDRWLTGVFGAALAWALIASSWSYTPWSAVDVALRVGLLLVAGLVLLDLLRDRDAAAEARLGQALACGLFLGALLIGLELATDHILYRTFTGVPVGEPVADSRVNRGATTLAILVWPAAASLRRQHGTAVALGLLGAVAIAVTASASLAALLALAAGAVFVPISLASRRIAMGLLAAAIATMLLAWPPSAGHLPIERLTADETIPESGRHRLHIWWYVGEQIEKRPLFGWGFDSSRSMPNFGVSPYLPDGGASVVPLHPHNAWLQIWLELGVPGIALAAALMALILRRTAVLAGDARAAAQVTLVSTLVVASLSYGIWQHQWIATLLAVTVLTRGTVCPAASPETAGRQAASRAAADASARATAWRT